MSRESDLYEATKSFLGAMQGIQKKFRFDTKAFARAADELRESNPVAAVFQTHEGVAGRTCQDFDDGLMMAQSACLCFFEAPTYNYIEINFYSRVAKRYQGRHVRSSRELAELYLEKLKDG